MFEPGLMRLRVFLFACEGAIFFEMHLFTALLLLLLIAKFCSLKMKTADH